jgi:signal transduction histidine kinase
MHDGPQSFPARFETGHGSVDVAASSYVSLLDAACSAGTASEAASRFAEWWREQTTAGPVAVGVAPESHRHGWIAIAQAQVPVRLQTIPACLLRDDVSWRATMFREMEAAEDAPWFPLADQGRIFGGLVLPAEFVPSAHSAGWLQFTARLLWAAIDREDRLRDARLESLAEFAAGAGHEINNPLGSILGRVQILARDEQHPERTRLLSTIGAQALRIRDMIGDVMLFGRPPEPRPEPVRLAAAVREALERSTSEMESRGIVAAAQLDAEVTVLADPAQLSIVISEILRNAFRAAPDGSRVELVVRSVRCGDRWIAAFEVGDAGPGLSEADQQHLFDPFYSGRQAGRGLGFGLSKCWRIVTGHGGCIHVENLHPGIRMIVHWPGP